MPGSIGRMNPWFKNGRERKMKGIKGKVALVYTYLVIFGVYLWIAKRYV